MELSPSGSDGWRLCPVDIQWLWCFYLQKSFCRSNAQLGIRELYTHIRHGKKYYEKYHEAIEAVESDEDFMALYEQMPEFDEFDDEFVVNEERWCAMIAAYIDDHIENFATIENE